MGGSWGNMKFAHTAGLVVISFLDHFSRDNIIFCTVIVRRSLCGARARNAISEISLLEGLSRLTAMISLLP